jgi:hypothetical protein
MFQLALAIQGFNVMMKRFIGRMTLSLMLNATILLGRLILSFFFLNGVRSLREIGKLEKEFGVFFE